MSSTLDRLFLSEEKHKEAVYSEFDKLKDDASESVRQSEAYIKSGSYEDQAAFMAHRDRNTAWQRRHEIEALLQKIYTKPYFAHIELLEQGEKESEHFYLSDNESLDRLLPVGDNGYLIPFKLDKKRPIANALFHCYQSRSVEEVRYKENETGNDVVFSTLLICDDEVKNRELLNVMQLFPEEDLFSVKADELLEQILRENRHNPLLRNIIATLQQQQFRIIETDVEKSFVVQGCAGSGKSQCLFHRLFFLRDTLSQEGWDRVLLLTPTQLFRNYSADLIRRYQLSDINDCSIAELYRSLLNAYDTRFRNRQYQFELSEEYLPDDYLKAVYSQETISRIDTEIERAISHYVESGCKALGIPMIEKFDINDVARIVDQLEIAIQKFDNRESVLQQETEYVERRKQYEETKKIIILTQQNLDKLAREQEQISKDTEQILALSKSYQEAINERDGWNKHRAKRIESAGKALAHFDRLPVNNGGIDAPARYMQQLFVVRDLTSGKTFQSDEEYRLYLDDYCDLAQKELAEKTNNQSFEKVLSRIEKRKKTIRDRLSQLSLELEQANQTALSHEEWLREKASKIEGERSAQTLLRADMERAKYFMSRIESSVFEQEVWKALSPQKEQYNIQTTRIDEREDGRKRETRILYKSDLLFYLKIYTRLHGNLPIHQYTLLCIDEGQDLHKADYELLKSLYPEAAFNIFGDTEQVLHSACGIHDWMDETGISSIFSLDRNYRNEASIVEFCNSHFGCSMKYVGKAQEAKTPKILYRIREILPLLNEENISVIVKDKSSFGRLCKAAGIRDQLEFLDTNSFSVSEDKVPCYSIFAAKGLEFPKVLVIADEMTLNQRIVACTRATERLYYYE